MSKDKCCVPEAVVPSGIGGVEFRDGAVVTAGDLNQATEYPVQLLKRFIKGFFGCGVVHGLEVLPVDNNPWKIRVTAGVAIDANGFPLELVREARLDLSCLRCAEPGEEGNTYTVAISYGNGDQANTGEQCGAVANSGNSESVKIAVFGAGCEPSGLCKKEGKDKQPENSTCPPCSADDAGESWVPVWCVKVVEVGEGDNKKVELDVPEGSGGGDCRFNSCSKDCSDGENILEETPPPGLSGAEGADGAVGASSATGGIDLVTVDNFKDIEKRLERAEKITHLWEDVNRIQDFYDKRDEIFRGE